MNKNIKNPKIVLCLSKRFNSNIKYKYVEKVSNSIPKWRPRPVAILCAGTIAYSMYHLIKDQKQGGPGAGKGTQCAKIVEEFGFVHLSAGDLLRYEMQRPGSEYGDLIQSYIKEGQIVPMEITIALLKKAMIRSNKNRFLIDGFPRKMDQAVCPSRLVLYFECPQKVMLERLIKRGETSGRSDDNIESIKKRFVTFEKTSKPVIDKYDKDSKVETISCIQNPDLVYENTRKAILKILKQTHKN